MKKPLFILTVISLLMVVNVYSQSKELLIRYDEDAFKKAAEKVHYSDYNKEELYNRDLFRAYREQKGVTLDFSEKDYRDAQTNVNNLTKVVSDLNNAKENKEKELSVKEKTVREKDSIINALTNDNKVLNKQLLSKDKLEEQLKKKRDSITDLKSELSELKQRNSELENEIRKNHADIAQLVEDTTNIRKKEREAISEKEKIASTNKALQTQLNNKNEEIQNLSKSNISLSEKNNEFQKAFNETEKAINDVYQANIVKPIAEMNPEQLDKARSKFEGMKSLLSIDQKLYKDLEGKVNEISSWRALVEPIKGARQYLKGKYDDKKRKDYIAAINKVSISGSKANEKQAMLDNLNNQYQLKDNYDIIVDNLDETGCLPNIEQLQEAFDMLNRRKEIVKQFYRPNVFDSYDRGIKIIEDELSKPTPSNKVKTAAEFNKFIQELKDIF